MLVFILFVLLLASIFGVLTAVLKVALAIVLAVVLAVVVLVGSAFYFLRHRLRAWQHDLEREVERRRRHAGAHEIHFVQNEADSDPPGSPPALGEGGDR